MKHIIEDNLKKNEFILIAEIGVNYYDIAKKEGITPMDAAKLMIVEASQAGIHAVKFQSYKAETIASKDSPYYWNLKEESTRSQYELFKKYDSFGEKEYRELAEFSENNNIEFLSTPFDIESADYLEPMMNVYKISSSDLNNLNFVEYQAKKNKPIIMSVGASNEDEIIKSVDLIRKHNDKPLVLMHCVLEYPTPYEHANLRKISTLKRLFPDIIVGYSDHTKPYASYDVIKTAYVLGARVIEKHFTLDKTLTGNDHYHAMDPDDAKRIIESIEKIEKICGKEELKCLDSELRARENARRSLVAAKPIVKGDIITSDMVTWKRPGTGISVADYERVIGCVAIKDIEEDGIIKEDMIEWKRH